MGTGPTGSVSLDFKKSSSNHAQYLAGEDGPTYGESDEEEEEEEEGEAEGEDAVATKSASSCVGKAGPS
eukprot:COSAG04_NODE_12640_length_642_cov_1.125230_1_plen_69_part_00